MRHNKTPVIFMRERVTALTEKVAALEQKLEAADRWANYCMGQAIKHTNEQVLKKDYLKQFKYYQ